MSKDQRTANAPSGGVSALSVAVISPDRERRGAALSALGEAHSGPTREFISYPPNMDDVSRTLNRDYDVVLVDLDTEPEYALNLVKAVSLEARATVMVFSVETDPAMLLSSMRAGAREFLTVPFAPGVMADALQRALVMRPAIRTEEQKNHDEGRLLVFLGAKGGSGVTTLACNFAVALAQNSGKKTLLIDLNLPLGDAAINLGMRAQHSIVSALQHYNRLDANLLSTMLEAHGSGLSVLAAPSQLATTHLSDEAIDKLVEVARQEFDSVVVDAGSRLELQSTKLFDASAVIYLVTQIGIAELRNSNRVIQRLSSKSSPKLEIVINRYDQRNQEISEELVNKALTRQADWKIPNDYASVRRMQHKATPLIDEDSEIARAIRQMSAAITGQPVVQEKKKLFGFFR
jgi:pilus assembly protein CpaE